MLKVMDQATYFLPPEYLDRLAHRRIDNEWLATQAGNGARYAFVWRGCNLFRTGGGPIWLGTEALPADIAPSFLGVLPNGCPLFAVDLGGYSSREVALHAIGQEPATAAFTQIREFQGPLAPDERALLFYARSLVHWQNQQQHCGRCGSPTRAQEAGHMMLCSNPECATTHFPRTDPAVIMLVSDGDRCLLGRQPVWPEGVYSTLAGFVETGESLEQAVVREVREESGIELTGVQYFGSQPWPFPQSLMLGFFAQAASTEIECGAELAEVRWFDVAETKEVLGRLENRFPHLDTIARRLIRTWLGSRG
jgi:NAD+ diphosphatase